MNTSQESQSLEQDTNVLSTETKKKRVCVIGAGPSGITAAKNFKDQGFEVTVYDYGTGVGGNWRYNDQSGHSSVFETTHIISSKTLSQYEDFPLPAHLSDYPSHRELLDYFTCYAKHFDLLPLIQFQTLVEDCHPQTDGRWFVRVRRGEHVDEQLFDALVVCNGHHWKPRWPDYPGKFEGLFLHSHDYKKAAPFAGKRVLVIGGGNSACDIAVETSRVSALTDISWRRGYWLVPKFMFGRPSDVVGKCINLLPLNLRQWVSRISLLLLQGSNRAIGLQQPDHEVGDTHPTINSELYYFVRHGRIKPRVDIASFNGKEVIFKDGSRQEYDVVIACTGYWISHPFFKPEVLDFSKGPVPLYLRFLPANQRNLYFIGLFQPLGCIWPGAELQSKLAARHLAGFWNGPTCLEAAIQRELAHPDYRQIQSPRHTITVDDTRFRKRLRRELYRSTKMEHIC